MLKKMTPNEYYNSIFDIDYKNLYSLGIRGLIFDIDNTLAPYDIKYPGDKVITLFDNLKQMGFRLALLSNNNEQRVSAFNERLSVLALSKGRKPSKTGAMSLIGLMNTTENTTALIGDQLFTDVACARNCGLHSVLVKPLSNREEWFVKLKRIPEKLILWRIKKCACKRS